MENQRTKFTLAIDCLCEEINPNNFRGKEIENIKRILRPTLMKSLKELCTQIVFKRCNFEHDFNKKWLNCALACIPKNVKFMLETTQFWYCDNWSNHKFLLENEKCKCYFSVCLKRVREEVLKLYGDKKFRLVYFVSNLQSFFTFISSYSDREWFFDFLSLTCNCLCYPSFF